MTKLKTWESKALTQTLTTVTQIQKHMETCLVGAELDNAALLPPSLIPTHQLYEIALCYTALYELLQEEHLIKSGNIKSTSNLH